MRFRSPERRPRSATRRRLPCGCRLCARFSRLSRRIRGTLPTGRSRLCAGRGWLHRCAERNEIVRVFNEARARAKRPFCANKRIGWNNVSLVVDVAILSVAISRVLIHIHREYARLHQGSLAHLLPVESVSTSVTGINSDSIQFEVGSWQ